MKTNLNKRLFFGALILAGVLLIPYEQYWLKAEHYPRTFDIESLDMWADQRERINDLDEQDVVILGSSRAHFDLNIHLWDSLTGRRPIQLAYPGSSPYFPIEEVVRNSKFKGLLVIGVAPGLFFSGEKSWGANRGKAVVDRYHDRTLAQIFNQRIYHYIDPRFSFVDEGLSLKNLRDRLPFPNRDSINSPDIWPPMVRMDEYRNIRMLPIMEQDTVFQRRQKDIWFNPKPKNRFADQKEEIMKHYLDLVHEFQERGGRVVFLRAPITGYYVDTEYKLYPRAEYWDSLVSGCGCTGYHYADYPETANMEPPEWSHLNRKDSDLYTRKIIQLLQEDELL